MARSGFVGSGRFGADKAGRVVYFESGGSGEIVGCFRGVLDYVALLESYFTERRISVKITILLVKLH